MLMILIGEILSCEYATGENPHPKMHCILEIKQIFYGLRKIPPDKHLKSNKIVLSRINAATYQVRNFKSSTIYPFPYS